MSAERLVRRPWEPMRLPMYFSGESRTEQSHAAAVDINNIIRRFARTGELPPALNPAVYEDVTRLQVPLAERIAFAEGTFRSAQGYLDGLPTDSPAVTPAPTPAPAVT